MAPGDVQRRTAEKRLTTTPTIFALATGAPPTAIAIIRISGPAAFAALVQLTGRPLPPPRTLERRTVRDAAGDPVDHALVAVFPAPASVTGDDVVELHLHGGVAVVAAALATLDRCGLTPAAAGAFTRRAFDNGKLDLAQVEALGDLIAAETDGQRRVALAHTGGALTARVAGWRATLIAVRADVEATLDFAEEDGVASGLTDHGRSALDGLRGELIAARADIDRAGRLRDGVTIAIVGPVNAGKSTLLNALARRDAAMVSPQPGTTRDVVEVRIDLAGVSATLIDTAGLRATGDVLEAEGIRRGIARAEGAEIVIMLGDMQNVPRGTFPVDDDRIIHVVSKSDLDPAGAGWRDGILHLSAATGDGIDGLEHHLRERVAALVRPNEPPLIVHRWQAAALDAAVAALGSALASDDVVLVAEELRKSTAALERLVGRVSSDELLDSVFVRFCIGK